MKNKTFVNYNSNTTVVFHGGEYLAWTDVIANLSLDGPRINFICWSVCVGGGEGAGVQVLFSLIYLSHSISLSLSYHDTHQTQKKKVSG